MKVARVLALAAVLWDPASGITANATFSSSSAEAHIPTVACTPW